MFYYLLIINVFTHLLKKKRKRKINERGESAYGDITLKGEVQIPPPAQYGKMAVGFALWTNTTLTLLSELSFLKFQFVFIRSKSVCSFFFKGLYTNYGNE
jgi:hypothetical protein